MKTRQLVSAVAAIALGGLFAAGNSQAQSYILDFGAPGQVVYDGTLFTGTPTPATNVGTGGPDFSLTGVEYDLGDVSLTFGLTGAFNLDGGSDPEDLAALNGSFFFSNTGNATVGSPVSFTITADDPGTVIEFEFIRSFQPFDATITITDDNNPANFISGTVNDDADFVLIGSLTGSTSYTAVFQGTGPEGNIAGARITVTPVPEPTAAAAFLLGGSLLALRRRRRA